MVIKQGAPSAWAATLPPEVVAAAQERGRTRDLDATVEELLVELGANWLPVLCTWPIWLPASVSAFIGAGWTANKSQPMAAWSQADRRSYSVRLAEIAQIVVNCVIASDLLDTENMEKARRYTEDRFSVFSGASL